MDLLVTHYRSTIVSFPAIVFIINFHLETLVIFQVLNGYDRIASLESRSSHPMSVAIVSYCRQKGIEPVAEVQDFEVLEGEGICGVVDNNKVYIGKCEAEPLTRIAKVAKENRPPSILMKHH